MARRDALERGLFAVVYLPLYAIVLYPVAFALGIIVAAVNILLSVILRRRVRFKSELAANAWRAISQPVTWVFSGEPRDKPGWVP